MKLASNKLCLILSLLVQSSAYAGTRGATSEAQIIAEGMVEGESWAVAVTDYGTGNGNGSQQVGITFDDENYKGWSAIPNLAVKIGYTYLVSGSFTVFVGPKYCFEQKTNDRAPICELNGMVIEVAPGLGGMTLAVGLSSVGIDRSQNSDGSFVEHFRSAMELKAVAYSPWGGAVDHFWVGNKVYFGGGLTIRNKDLAIIGLDMGIVHHPGDFGPVVYGGTVITF